MSAENSMNINKKVACLYKKFPVKKKKKLIRRSLRWLQSF